ncbi:response regulator transcription factor [Proteocatella sphenisci]|uniref:response regulator transcription factor n=1 Tax=Proteocatella sphenisci TaxID=181070 RepID=UPI00048E1597|nr:response regulator transcription factor [Proteocatella sphenisci]
MKILIVEDEYAIRSFITLNFKREGALGFKNDFFEVFEAESGEEAIRIFEENEDIRLVLLDVMLPGIDGFEVLKYLREKSDEIGIIMLTARTHEQDKVMGLEYGADDYISKPFSPAELIARVRSLIRRLSLANSDENEKYIKSGIFKIDIEDRKYFKGKEEIELTPKEFEILELFMKNKGKSLSRDHILNEIWGKNYFGDLKVVDVNMRRIRKKIEEDPANPLYLKTVWGFGYRWEEDEN